MTRTDNATQLLASLNRMGEWKSRYDPDEDDMRILIYVDDDPKRGTVCPIAEVLGQQLDDDDNDLDLETTSARFAILIRESPNLYRECVDARDRIRELIEKEDLSDAAENWLESIASNLDDRITDAEDTGIL